MGLQQSMFLFTSILSSNSEIDYLDGINQQNKICMNNPE